MEALAHGRRRKSRNGPVFGKTNSKLPGGGLLGEGDNPEAPGCGLPVVASRTGGIPEFIEDGRTGFLFPPGDHRALAERLRRLVEDGPARDAMSRAARAVALERFSASSRLDENLSLFRVEGPG